MRLLVLALAAPLALIGAAYPDKADLPPAAPTAANPISGPVTYRPCRPGRGDDRCIQLYERGVRASYARWLREHGVRERTEVAAVGGPVERPAPRAPDHARHASSDDHRCHSDDDRHGDARGM